MKLLLPVTTLILAAGFCCCGGDSVTELEQLSSGGSPTVTAPQDGGAAAPVAAAGGPTSEVSGTCGRFTGLKAPAGASVMACSVSGDSDSLVLLGGAAPAENCKVLKEWAVAAGYTIEADVNAMGSYAITGSTGTTSISIACTDVGGSTTSSLSISPKM